MSSSPMTDVLSPQEAASPPDAQTKGAFPMLVSLYAATTETLHTMLDHLYEAFPGRSILLTSPDVPSDSIAPGGSMQMVQYPQQAPHSGWVLTAADYLASANLLREYNAGTALLLGPEAASLSRSALQGLVAAVEAGADLALPRYELGPHEGLVNGALLYPLSHSLFGVEAHLPLPLDAAFSARMAARLSSAARKPASAPGNEALLWPAAEAAVASLQVREVPVGKRILPQPDAYDLNSLLVHIAGSLFADLEAKAAFWQRARSIPLPAYATAAATGDRPDVLAADWEEIKEMADSFRNAYANLQEIWSLVVPPQSLLALKKLSLTPPEAFTMPANLWARMVYDFVLAYRLRTINRGHLLGAFTPLYLAWVASHLRRADNDAKAAELHIEETAAAFIAERPYVLARWRWPDRFNP